MAPAEETTAAALLITGTVGAGKTTTATAIGDRLGALEVPHAVIDLDWLRRSWPAPRDDPFNLGVELRNLQAVTGTFVRAGARRLVLAGVVESAADRERYEQAVGMPLLICRLEVDLTRVRTRLRQRHRPGRELDWHLARSGELDEIQRAAAPSDHVVPVAEQTPEQVALDVLSAVGWDRPA